MNNRNMDKEKNVKTNVVYIILDDMGYSDLGCFGSEVRTPNIDKLAANGLLYNDFAVCPASSPTRASLLTGRENHAVGMGMVANVVLGPDRPTIQGRIVPEAATIAEILKENGYSTMGVGKWHVAPVYHLTPAGPFDYWPLAKGFERFYGFLDGETDQYKPVLIQDNQMIDPPKKEGYHLSSDLVDKSIKFVTDQVSVYPNKPFFLNLAFGVAHSPHQVPREYIEMYEGMYDKGWDVLREARYHRQLEMGIIPTGTELSPKDPLVKDWDSMDDVHKKLYIRFQETYAGFITHCDEQVGRFIDYLDSIGELDNTMIYLISDNGASRDGGTEGIDDFVRSMNGSSPSFEDLFARIEDIGGPDMKALYPKGWAHASNTPFKEYKGTNYAGGTRCPLIVHWPAGIKTKGEIRSQHVDVTDVTPTVLELIGIHMPEAVKGVKQMPMHGISFAQTFGNDDEKSKRSIKFYLWANSRAIYADGWKALSIHKPGTAFDNDRWELYKVSEDFSETRNIVETYPDKLEELKGIWWEEAAKYGVLPLAEMKPSDQGYIPLDSSAAGISFKFLQGMDHLGWMSDPPIENRSYTITVPIFREDKDVEGVLVCSGDGMGGYTLYIKENRLIYEYNKFGTRYKIESDMEVPMGSTLLKYDFEKTGNCIGIGSLYINDSLTGQTEIESVPFSLSLENTDVGRDALSTVSKNYQDRGDFEFTGKIEYVKFDLRESIHDSIHAAIKGGPLGN